MYKHALSEIPESQKNEIFSFSNQVDFDFLDDLNGSSKGNVKMTPIGGIEAETAISTEKSEPHNSNGGDKNNGDGHVLLTRHDFTGRAIIAKRVPKSSLTESQRLKLEQEERDRKSCEIPSEVGPGFDMHFGSSKKTAKKISAQEVKAIIHDIRYSCAQQPGVGTSGSTVRSKPHRVKRKE